MGPYTASSCCCQPRNLPWGPVPTPHCCCQARKSVMGPCYASSCCLPGPECVMGPCTAFPLLLSLFATLCQSFLVCHFQVSLTLLVCSIFVIGCLYGLPFAAAPPPPTTVAPHSWFLAPVICPNE
ncbi:unnamed protein product [Staurois parvus]|uniref:Uncharacterized protein n=1 Tax=Staurois parvus TaxID=386267 RepID=A0ABN9CPB7_9NEOB|nr:unnamed protein product [Staurois parvus]